MFACLKALHSTRMGRAMRPFAPTSAQKILWSSIVLQRPRMYLRAVTTGPSHDRGREPSRSRKEDHGAAPD